MKLIVAVALALVAVAGAASLPEKEPTNILRSEFVQDPDGTYNFNFEIDNGSRRDEAGELKEVLDEENKPQTVVVVRGTYEYVGDDGKPVSITYYADETGYHAEGDSIPQLPSSRR